MSNKIKQRFNSDSGAALSVEMIVLIALAIFAVMMVFKYIMTPMGESAESIGKKIKDMGD